MKRSDRLAKRVHSDEMRQLSSHLFFCSPKAHALLRRYFRFPRATSIRHWMMSVDGSPGVNSTAIEKIRSLSSTCADWVLIIDTMSIRKQACWSHTRETFTGFVDIGLDQTSKKKFYDMMPLATEAVVILACSLSSVRWKIPVAYALSASATPQQQCPLIQAVIAAVNEAGACIRALVADGCSTNLATFTRLGAALQTQPWFTVSSQPHRIFVLLDNCYLIKLAKNCLSDFGAFAVDGQVISWSFLRRLCHLQEREGYHLGNRLTSRHLEWSRHKTKVALATETFNASVAEALLFLLEIGHPDFEGCRPTIEFVQKMGRLFDIFNSK